MGAGLPTVELAPPTGFEPVLPPGKGGVTDDPPARRWGPDCPPWNWHPQRDSNPCYRRERAGSPTTRPLDDGGRTAHRGTGNPNGIRTRATAVKGRGHRRPARWTMGAGLPTVELAPPTGFEPVLRRERAGSPTTRPLDDGGRTAHRGTGTPNGIRTRATAVKGRGHRRPARWTMGAGLPTVELATPTGFEPVLPP